MATLSHSFGTSDYERAGPKGHRPLILFHTLLADRSVYDGIFPHLVEKRDVIRFQFPGFVASEGQCESIDDYAIWTIAFIRTLAIGQPVEIFSNGFGGFVSLGVISKAPDLVCSLTIANSGATFSDDRKLPLLKMAEVVEAKGIEAVLNTAISRMFPESFAKAHPAIVLARKSALRHADPRQFSIACRALATLDYRKAARAITVPVRIVAGLDDATTPPSMSQDLHQLISGSSYIEISDCGHCPQIQQPSRVLELLS